MQPKEGVPQELRNFKPESFEVMAGLVYAIDGSFPTDEQKFAKGLQAAAVKAPFLGAFVDEETEGLTGDAKSALEKLKTLGFIIRGDEKWTLSDSGDPLTSPKSQLNNRVESVFTKQGIAVLKEAVVEAKQIWPAEETE